MQFLNRKGTRDKAKLQLLKLSKQMQGVKNEMEFVEILTQFWPLPNMSQKMERLEEKLLRLNRQYAHFSAQVTG